MDSIEILPPQPTPWHHPSVRNLLAALLLALAPLHAMIPPSEALGLEARVRPGHQPHSPLRGMIALESGVLAKIRFFGGCGLEPVRDLPFHPSLRPRPVPAGAAAGPGADGAGPAPRPGLDPADYRHPQDATAALVQWLFPSPDGHTLVANLRRADPVGLIGREQQADCASATPGAGLRKVAALLEALAAFQAGLAEAGADRAAASAAFRRDVERILTPNPRLPSEDRGGFRRLLPQFSGILTRAAEEEAAGRATLYPPDTVAVALLAYAWQVADHLDELDRAFAGSVLEPPVPGAARPRYDGARHHAQALALAAPPPHWEGHRLEREDLALYLAHWQTAAPRFKPIPYGTATYRRHTFPDCGETSLRNFLNTVLWNGARLDPGLAPGLLRAAGDRPGRVAELEAFYRRFPTADAQLNSDARSAWSEVVSNLDGVPAMPVAYLRGPAGARHELAAGLPNMLGLIAHLLPDPELNQPLAAVPVAAKLDRLCALASRPGFILDWRVRGGGKVLAGDFPTLEFRVGDLPRFEWRFDRYHFAFSLLGQPDGSDALGSAPLMAEDPWLQLWVASAQGDPRYSASLDAPWRIFARSLARTDTFAADLRILLAAPNVGSLRATFRQMVARTFIQDRFFAGDILSLLTQFRERLAGPGWIPVPQLEALPAELKLDLLAQASGQGERWRAYAEVCLAHGPWHQARPETGKGLLHYLVTREAHPEFLAWSLGLGLDLEARDHKGLTPLHDAAANGNEAMIKELLDRGADLEAVDLRGETPLIHAVIGGYLGAARYLLERGARPDAADLKGFTPAEWARHSPDLEPLLPLLERGGPVGAVPGLPPRP